MWETQSCFFVLFFVCVCVFFLCGFNCKFFEGLFVWHQSRSASDCFFLFVFVWDCKCSHKHVYVIRSYKILFICVNKKNRVLLIILIKFQTKIYWKYTEKSKKSKGTLNIQLIVIYIHKKIWKSYEKSTWNSEYSSFIPYPHYFSHQSKIIPDKIKSQIKSNQTQSYLIKSKQYFLMHSLLQNNANNNNNSEDDNHDNENMRDDNVITHRISHNDEDSEEGPSIRNRRKWICQQCCQSPYAVYVLVVLLLVYILNQVDRFSLSVVKKK